jgi:hypothetical protein
MACAEPFSDSESDESHDFLDPPLPLEEALGFEKDSVEFRRFMVPQSYGLSVI